MKNLLYLPLLFLFSNLHAQQGVVFKIKYLPNHTYQGTVNMTINAKATLSGNDTIISKLTSQGITQPLALNVKMEMKGNTQTGPVGANNMFPLTMKYNFENLSGDLNGNDIPMPMDKLAGGMSIYGHVGPDGKLKADSISGGKVHDTSEVKVSQMMNGIQKNIKFPDHPMKIGETFTQDMPVNLPVAGKSMNIDSKVVYKLISIADGNAYFDLQQSMNMSIPISGATINLNGMGAGKLVYSIKDNFATDYSTNITLKVTGEIKTLKIDATAEMNMEYKYTVN